MKISLLVAVADNGVIGRKNASMPWYLQADLAHFKKITWGHPIIMGLKTYQTIGRPLPERLNIVMTRKKSFKIEGCQIANSLPEALMMAEPAKEVFIIGGGEIFKQVLPIADTIYLTKVHTSPIGNVYFHFNPKEWQENFRESHQPDNTNIFAYTFLTLNRKLDKKIT